MRLLARVAGGMVLTLLALCGAVNLFLGGVAMPSVVGKAPEGDSSRYRVAVLGDAQKGVGNLARILEVVKGEGVEFILQTGDLVAENDEGHYRLTALVLARAGLEVPFLAVPGNHDVKRDPTRFEREMGGLEFSFVRGPVAFLGVDNANGAPPDLDRLRKAIETFPPDRPVVLLMHVPPIDLQGETVPGYEPFLEEVGRGRIRYVLCGHRHDYIRKEIGGAVLIVNGVGGDFDSWQLKQGVYATLLEVDGPEISDRAVQTEPVHGVIENLEHLAIAHVAQAYRDHPLPCWFGTLLLPVLLLLLLRKRTGRFRSRVNQRRGVAVKEDGWMTTG